MRGNRPDGAASPHPAFAVPSLKVLAVPLLVGLAYYVAAKLGFLLTFYGHAVSVFWTSNAVLLGAFLLTPQRTWWLILLAVFPAHLLVELGTGVPTLMVLSWFVSNSSEALIGAWAIRRVVKGRFRLDRFAHVSVFVWCAIIFGTAVSTLLDAMFVSLNGWGDRTFREIFQARFFSNSLATATVVPFILAWANGGIAALRRAHWTRVLEAVLLMVGLIAICVFAFVLQRPGLQTSPALLYAPLPLLLWATVRFGPRGQSTAVLVVVVLSMLSTGQGRGPFVTTSAPENAFTVQLFFVAFAVTLISLAAVLEERQRAQAVAHQRGEQLQMAMNAAHITPWNWRLSNVTPAPADEHGDAPTREEGLVTIVGDTGGVHPADLGNVTRAIVASAAEGTPLKTEFRVREADGTVRWVLGQGKVVFDSAGQPTGMIGLTADITDRKAIEALSVGENRILEMIATGAPLSDILNSVAYFIEAESSGLLASILLLDDDGVHVRHGAAPSLPEDYVKSIDGINIGPNAGSCGTAMHRRERVIVTDIESDPLWQDYREVALPHNLRACWSTPIFSDQGQVLGSFALYYHEPRSPTAEEIRLIDIATQLATIAIERKRVDAEVHEQRTALAHLGRVAMLGELSGALAHELAQPLTAVLSNAQAAQRLLDRDPPDIEQVREILLAIISADRRAGDVIHRLRPMLTKGHAQLAPLNLNDVVFDTLRLARADLTAREVFVTTRMNTELPLVRGDRVQLQQVILNLIINACDAMSAVRPADRRLVIAGRRARDTNGVELSITDAGTGIPNHLIGRIFDPFYSSKEHGLGLGLSICRSIVMAHRGSLRAANNPGGGATFSLSLPADGADAESRDGGPKSNTVAD